MWMTTRLTGPSRRTFILAGAAGALAARWILSPAHAQPAVGNINFRVTGTQRGKAEGIVTGRDVTPKV